MRRVVLAFVVLGLCSSAGAFAFVNEPTRTSLPGAYATLAFKVEGSGDYGFRVSASGGARVVQPSQSMSVDGVTTVFATVHVPQRMEAGSVIQVRVEALATGSVVAVGKGAVRIEQQAAIALSLDPKLTTRSGEPAILKGSVTNLGNVSDTVTVRAVAPVWPTKIRPSSVRLAPGQTEGIEITVTQLGTVTSGFRYIARFVATSAVSPDVEDPALVSLYFVDPDQEALANARAPTLLFGVSVRAQDRLRATQGNWTNTFSYGIDPVVRGSLSDYVSGSVAPASLSGNQDDVVKPPRSVALSLDAPTWHAGLTLGLDAIGLTGSVDLPGVTLASGARAGFGGTGNTYGVTVSVVGTEPSPDVRAELRSFLYPGGHNEGLSAHYGARIGRQWTLGAGVQLYGVGTTRDLTYHVIPALSQDAGFRARTFTVTETYSVLPTLGRHSLALQAGTYDADPVGVNATARATLEGASHSSSTSVTLFGYPTRDVGVSATATLHESAPGYGALVVNGQVTAGVDIAPGLHNEVVAGYQHGFPLWGNTLPSDSAGLSVSMGTGVVGGAVHGNWANGRGLGSTTPYSELSGGITLSLSPAEGSELVARYDLTHVSAPTVEDKSVYGATWNQTLTGHIASTLAYERTIDQIAGLPQTSPERLDASLSLIDIGLHGLDLSLGYRLSNPTGWFSGRTRSTNDFSVALGYTLSVPFRTPDAIVALFGGRESGVVYGTAYVRRDGTDTPLAGLTVRLGDQSVVTAPDGSYSLRVPPGAYDLTFAKGLPATLGFQGEARVPVVVNQRLRRDLEFRPVVDLSVTVFDDANRDGRQEAGEVGIPYAGVLVTGPVTVRSRTDKDGKVSVPNLPGGQYRVSVDDAHMPRGYTMVGEPVPVTLDPPRAPQAVVIGAAPQKRTVVMTFDSNQPSVFASLSESRAPAGADIRVAARTTGSVEKVELEMFGKRIELQRDGADWQATVHIPEASPSRLVDGSVVGTTASGALAKAAVHVLVTKGPLFEARPIRATHDRPADADVTTRFRAHSVVLKVGTAVFPLSTEDGYGWHGQAELKHVGTFEADVIADGRVLGQVTVEVSGGD